MISTQRGEWQGQHWGCLYDVSLRIDVSWQPCAASAHARTGALDRGTMAGRSLPMQGQDLLARI